MSRRTKILYWIVTLWLALGMTSTAIVQLLKLQGESDFALQLGYPVYFLTLLGVWKILGVIAILLPGFPVMKEWAYAGFFFAMSGAIFSYLAKGHEASDFFGPALLLMLTIASWYLRPANRRIVAPGATKDKITDTANLHSTI